jgi:formylmethanofuran dehydrogenase subunit E-like metal-binding protein
MDRRILASIAVITVTCTACGQLANSNFQQIKNQVADDAVKQYLMTVKSGSLMDQCVQAGLVSAAYLQAEDQSNYAAWKGIETSACARAGIRR